MTDVLKKRLQTDGILVAPGAYDALGAKLIEHLGFEAVYMTGAGIAYSLLGRPDIGELTLLEMSQRASYLAGAVNIPIIADADTGFGNEFNVIRTVNLYKQAGVAAIQLEDQEFPKRCGHLEGKSVIATKKMVSKIKAAKNAVGKDDLLIIARTDVRSLQGIEKALERGKAYEDAGADILFIEAPQSLDEMKIIAESFEIPVMANMVEGGKTPLLTITELEDIGYNLVIFPNSMTRAMVKSGIEVLTEIRDKGGTGFYLEKMMDFTSLNQLLGIDAVKELEKSFQLEE